MGRAWRHMRKPPVPREREPEQHARMLIPVYARSCPLVAVQTLLLHETPSKMGLGAVAVRPFPKHLSFYSLSVMFFFFSFFFSSLSLWFQGLLTLLSWTVEI
jgi:hypothetical protein